jgi:hypothetical protein
MMLSTLFLIAALAPNRAEPVVPAPAFAVGDEIGYSGEVAEESARVDLPYKRAFALDVRVFVLGVNDKTADLAVMTLLRPKADANVAGAASAVTGVDPAKSPPAVRLELVRVDAQGRAALLVPGGAPPFLLNDRTPTKPIPPLAPDAPASLELGFLAPRPPKAGDRDWTIASRGLPDWNWRLAQSAVRDGAQVVEFVGERQTAKWADPGGLETNWRRTDSLWIATADGLARQFTRTVELKDGVHVVAKRVTSCVLSTPPSPNRGEGYAAIRKEIEAAVGFAAEADAGMTARLRDRIEAFERRGRETPYRVALEAVKRRLK